MRTFQNVGDNSTLIYIHYDFKNICICIHFENMENDGILIIEIKYMFITDTLL